MPKVRRLGGASDILEPRFMVRPVKTAVFRA